MKLLFIDPMSYNNLGIYDKCLLENINCGNTFFSSKYFQFDNIKNTQIINNYTYQAKKGLRKLASYLYSQIKVILWIYKNNPQIIHFQWLKVPPLDIFLLLMIKTLYRKSRLVYTAHNIMPHDSGKKYLFLYYIIYHLFDGIIVHEKRAKKEIEKLFNLQNKNIMVIPHGLLNLNCNKKYIYKDKIVFSLIGRISKYKGIDILLEAWTKNGELLNDNSIRLIIAGEGEILLDKKYFNKNIVVLNRYILDDEIQEIIKQTDVGILPYRQISQSGVLLSFLAEHKPVIVSNCGGLIQPFEIGNVGWILKELTPMSLADQIIDIKSHRHLIDKIKNDKNLWHDIDSYYSWNRIGKLTSDYYHMILS
jgi:glycosyltransferase involved in cell wall biosynthesis